MNCIALPCDGGVHPHLLCPDLLPVALEYQNPWFMVFSRGGYYTFEYERSQVVILPVVDGREVVMVRVKRPVIADAPLELPAGDSRPGETTRVAAQRELAEETGIWIADVERFVPDLPLSEMPGRMPVLLSVFRVNISTQEFEVRGGHDDEVLCVEALPFKDVALKVLGGEIYLSSPMAILARLLLGSISIQNSWRIGHEVES